MEPTSQDSLVISDVSDIKKVSPMSAEVIEGEISQLEKELKVLKQERSKKQKDKKKQQTKAKGLRCKWLEKKRESLGLTARFDDTDSVQTNDNRPLLTILAKQEKDKKAIEVPKWPELDKEQVS